MLYETGDIVLAKANEVTYNLSVLRTFKMRILLAAMILGFALATVGVWLNRGSEKIVTTFGLGLAAIVAASISVLVFGADEPIHRAFSSIVTIDGTSHLPFEFIGFSAIPIMNLISARDELKKHPELQDADDTVGAILYHHLLQRGIISWLQEKYPMSWEAEVFPLDLGESHGYMFTSKSVPSMVYKPTELAQQMAGNKFADLPGPFGPALGLAVPPATRLKVTSPHHDKQLGEVGKILLKNEYSTITIETRHAADQRGVGSYALIFGLSEDQSNALWTHQYLVIVDASFRWFLAGNPEMPRYRKRALEIATGLENQFDERILWSKARDSFLLRRGLTLQLVPTAAADRK